VVGGDLAPMAMGMRKSLAVPMTEDAYKLLHT
jgi:hypothetical protein